MTTTANHTGPTSGGTPAGMTAGQSSPDGTLLHGADDRGVPPHVLWQWVR